MSCLRLELCVDHVGQRHEEGAAEHEVGHDAQDGQRNRKTENEKGQHHPFDAAQVSGDVGLRGGVDGLKEALSKYAVIDNRTIDEPCEARRAVNLTFPFCRARWAEEDQMFETKQGLRLSVAVLLPPERSRA